MHTRKSRYGKLYFKVTYQSRTTLGDFVDMEKLLAGQPWSTEITAGALRHHGHMELERVYL